MESDSSLVNYWQDSRRTEQAHENLTRDGGGGDGGNELQCQKECGGETSIEIRDRK